MAMHFVFMRDIFSSFHCIYSCVSFCLDFEYFKYADVVKTRMQKQVIRPGREPKYTGIYQSCVLIAKEEGYGALWKGITPRLMRIMPGQAITFMTYEAVSSRLTSDGYLS